MTCHRTKPSTSSPSEIGKNHAVDFRDDSAYGTTINELVRLLNDPVRPLTAIGATPALPPAFVNRPQYLEPLKKAVHSGDPLIALTSKQEVAALVGIGGIGKTTLAAALCHDCEIRRTFDQIYWIDVGSDRRGEAYAADLMRAAIGGLPDDYRDLATARASLARHLQGSKTLIVLDDVWDIAIVKAFQLGGVDVRILMTTRQKRILNILGAQGQEIDKLSEIEALKVLYERCGRILDDRDSRSVISILGGHAQAIWLAGTWLRNRGGKSAADLLNRLEKHPDFSDLNLDENDKNLNLERALRLSYDDLPNEITRAHFRALGVCAHNTSLNTAMLGALWEIEDEDELDDAISLLVDAGLLTPDETATYYSQHPLLRAYALALLIKQDEFEAKFTNYANYVTEEILEFEVWAAEQKELKEKLLHHIHDIGDRYYKKAITNVPPLSTEDEEDLLNFFLGSLQYFSARLIHKIEWIETAIILSKKHNNDDFQFIFLNSLGVYYSQSGNKIKALECYTEAKNFAEPGLNFALLLNNMGRIYDDLNQHSKALALFKESLKYTGSSSFIEANTHNNLGMVYEKLNQPQKALKQYRKALGHSTDKHNRATILNNIGSWYLAKGKFHKAKIYLTEALDLRKEIGDIRGTGITLKNLGKTLLPTTPEQALVYFIESLTLQEKAGDKFYAASAHFQVAQAYKSLRQIDKAIYHMEQCVNLDIEVQHPDLESDRAELNRVKALAIPKQLSPYQIQDRIESVILSCSLDQPDVRNLTITLLKQDIEEARKYQDSYELEFFTALLNITQGKKLKALPHNPYSSDLKYLLARLERKNS